MPVRGNPVLSACGGLSVVLLLFGAAALGAAEQTKPPPAPDAPACRLNIQGKFVEWLMLVDEQDRQELLHVQGDRVAVEPGRYRVREVQLKGGYHSYVSSDREEDWFTVGPGSPHQLKVGAPLTPKVRVTRQGPLLKLDYQLLDAGGRNYSNRESVTSPRFTVYKDGREIASGAFEYG
jgi:hypothetical protein